MSYIVRSGRLLSAGPLADTPGEEYVQIRVQVFDQFWSDTSPEMDTATTYTVMVVGQAACEGVFKRGRYEAMTLPFRQGVENCSPSMGLRSGRKNRRRC
jgi:hypothetical protein